MELPLPIVYQARPISLAYWKLELAEALKHFFWVVRPLAKAVCRDFFTFIFQLSGLVLVAPLCFALHC